MTTTTSAQRTDALAPRELGTVYVTGARAAWGQRSSRR